MKRVFSRRFCFAALTVLSSLTAGCFRDPAEAEFDTDSGTSTSTDDSTAGSDDTEGTGDGDTGGVDTTGTDPDCTCFVKNACCDGCSPINEGGACLDDGAACTEDVCRGGGCEHDLDEGYCFIDGQCRRHNNENPQNECQYCDRMVSSTEWTDQKAGEACNDGDPCTTGDQCNAGVCRGEEVACADGDGCCPSHCGVDEDKDCCDAAACSIERDGCLPIGCGFDEDADAPCDSADDVRQPGTNLCWRRCPVGQTWTGGSCSGTRAFVDWCDASGKSEGDCTSDYPGAGICSTFGEDYRLPSGDDYHVLFESGGCSGETQNLCTQMFGVDTGEYWTSTTVQGQYPELVEMELGEFELGHKYEDENGGPGAGAAVRCVKTGP